MIDDFELGYTLERALLMSTGNKAKAYNLGTDDMYIVVQHGYGLWGGDMRDEFADEQLNYNQLYYIPTYSDRRSPVYSSGTYPTLGPFIKELERNGLSAARLIWQSF